MTTPVAVDCGTIQFSISPDPSYLTLDANTGLLTFASNDIMEVTTSAQTITVSALLAD